MLSDRVLFTGSSSASHPVLDQLFGGNLEPRPGGGDHDLVVVDGRADDADLDAARSALRSGIAVLILSPKESQLDPLASIAGAMPKVAAQAVFLAPNRNRKEPARFEGAMLLESPQRGDLITRSKETPVPADADPNDRPEKSSSTKRANEKANDAAVENFAKTVEARVTRGFHPQPLDLPDGLKYLQTTWTASGPFTNSACDDDDNCFQNGTGGFSVTYTVWGFLSQTASANSQYLIIEGTYVVNPGALAENDDEGRGFLNTSVTSSVGPTSGGFALTDHIPNNGTDSWSENFSIDISYANPLGGYDTYTFQNTVSQSIGSWSVQNNTNLTNAGCEWFVNSPLNGSNLQNEWDDAFDGTGHLEDFPSASTATINVQETCAWQTSQIQTSTFTVWLNLDWYNCVFYAKSCGLIFCYSDRAILTPWHVGVPFTADFSSITP